MSGPGGGSAGDAPRARLVSAGALLAAGDPAGAAREALTVIRWAAARTDPAGPAALAEAELLLARVFARVGDGTSSLDRATRAFDAAQAAEAARAAAAAVPGAAPDGDPDADPDADPDGDPDGDPARRVSLLLALAEAFLLTGAVDEAREEFGRAQSACSDVGDVDRLLLALDGTVRTELAAGRHEAAVEAARTVLAASEHGRVPLPPEVRDGAARALLGTGRVEEAEQLLRVGLAGLAGDEENTAGVVRLRLRLVTALRRLGRVHEAGQLLEESLRAAGKPGLEELAVDGLAEQAELLATQLRFEDAYRAQRRFHAAWSALSRQRQQVAVRTRQAVLRTAEARELAEQFRDQALRDDLTGLWNRRYLDQRLPLLLADGAARAERPLVAAIIDLDGFKQVNDTRSHLVGDRVMQAVASIVRAALGGPLDTAHDARPDARPEARPDSRTDTRLDPRAGFAARLGGDEYAVVLTGRPEELLPALERVREAVAGYPWQPITDGLAVTVSLGVAIAAPGDTQHSLLTRADALLYRAKAAGRNRLEHDPLP